MPGFAVVQVKVGDQLECGRGSDPGLGYPVLKKEEGILDEGSFIAF